LVETSSTFLFLSEIRCKKKFQNNQAKGQVIAKNIVQVVVVDGTRKGRRVVM
jgi:hypothetical protein